MKKLSKLFALALALLMCLTTVFSSFAAENTIIDGSRTGSITVHKYAEEDWYDSTEYLTQTEMAEYLAGLGDSVTPLPGVTFKYVKVGDIKQYTKSVVSNGAITNVVKVGYSIDADFASLIGLRANDIDQTIDGVNYYSVSTLDECLNTVSATKIEQYIANKAGSESMPATDANGMSKVSGLDLGLYLLCEYSYPANTVGNEQHGHSVPCLIPIPLSDIAADGSNSWVYDVNVYPKNVVEDITIDKVIVGNDNSETKEWDMQINGEVEFLIRVDVPHGVGKLKTYTINDTLSNGLDYNTGSYKVYGVTSTGTRALLTNGQQFVFTSADTHHMTWAFDPTRLANAEGWAIYDSIEIRYTATLNKDAVVGGEGNPNAVELLISRLTNPEDPEPVDTYVPTELPRVYTYAIDLTKYGDSDSTNPLEDVTFELQDANENVITVSEQTAGVKGFYYVDPNGTATLTTAADGHVYVKGLEAGTYYMKETATNHGYSLLADKIEIVISSNENTYTEDANGTYAPVYSGKRYYTDETFADTTSGGSNVLEDTDTVVPGYNFFVIPSISTTNPDVSVPDGTFVNFNTSDVHTYPDGNKVQMYKANKLTWSANFVMGESRDEADTGVVSIVVNDQKIFELPHTGGVGMYIFVAVGVVFVAAAAWVAMSAYKRKEA